MFLTECDAILSGLKGVNFADLASLIKLKYLTEEKPPHKRLNA